MLIDGAEANLEIDDIGGVRMDVVITSDSVAERPSLVTSATSRSHCDVKSIAARRKRLEIKRFRIMAASGSFTNSSSKRFKVNGTVVEEVQMESGSRSVKDTTGRIAGTGEGCATDTTESDVIAPIRVAVRSHLSLEATATTEVATQSIREGRGSCAKLSSMEVADITCCRAAGSSDGVSRTRGSGSVEKFVDANREGVQKPAVFGAGLSGGEELERRVGSVELRRRSADRPPPGLRCPDFGAVSVCGRRREMEDAAVVVPGFLTLPGGRGSDAAEIFHFFGVYDGHGGSQVAEFCKERLHTVLADEMNVAAASAGTPEAQWEAAMVASFQRVDAELGGICTPETTGTKAEAAAWCCVGPLAPGSVGSTAVVAVIGGGRIVVGNCGDSRAVLCRGGRSVPLSRDHKPGRPDEMARIEAAGGRVISWNGYRVLGVLAMSRAIGDRYLKPYVISIPEITFTFRSDEDDCLILASDGLWDVLSNDVVCDVTRRFLAGSRSNRHSNWAESEETPAEAAAALLTKLALAKNSRDNISVVVVDLKAYPR